VWWCIPVILALWRLSSGHLGLHSKTLFKKEKKRKAKKRMPRRIAV
jgi:hypothetical protein